MSQISIVGYESDSKCQHCGKALKHGIRISDGRIVGATCLDKQITAPKKYSGKPYRIGADLIIRAAKTVEFYAPSQWARFGVSASTLVFTTI